VKQRGIGKSDESDEIMKTGTTQNDLHTRVKTEEEPFALRTNVGGFGNSKMEENSLMPKKTR